MWFALLGPLLVHDGETQVEVPKGRLRILLAALLLRNETTVSAGALAEAVWDGAPPSSAETTLRWHVLRLSRVLGSHNQSMVEPDTIGTAETAALALPNDGASLAGPPGL
jgi:DNA-binding SARP family transcriptional activator